MTGLRFLGKSKPSPEEAMASVVAVLSLLDESLFLGTGTKELTL